MHGFGQASSECPGEQGCAVVAERRLGSLTPGVRGFRRGGCRPITLRTGPTGQRHNSSRFLQVLGVEDDGAWLRRASPAQELRRPSALRPMAPADLMS
jgi:hypothetical protein